MTEEHQPKTMTAGPVQIRWTVSAGQIVTVVSMVVTVIWMFSTMNADIRATEKSVRLIEARQDRFEAATSTDLLSLQTRMGAQEVATARGEAQLRSIADMAARILQKLDAPR